jgi:hypothetical protein
MIRAVRRQHAGRQSEAGAEGHRLRRAGAQAVAAEQIAGRHGDQRLQRCRQLRNGDGIGRACLRQRQQVAGADGRDRGQLSNRCHVGPFSRGRFRDERKQRFFEKSPFAGSGAKTFASLNRAGENARGSN